MFAIHYLDATVLKNNRNLYLFGIPEHHYKLFILGFQTEELIP